MSEEQIIPLDICPVVLAGGSGTRLWPLSRTMYPKQFLRLGGTGSLLQQTVQRVSACCTHAPLLVCNEEHRFLTAEQIRELGTNSVSILLEPVARNTAPAIAVAAFQVASESPERVMAVFPADHRISDVSALQDCLATALQPAENGALVTFGVKPDRPETGYGYIKISDPDSTARVLPIETFVEKPDNETALEFSNDPAYYWNTGMFVFKASVYLDCLRRLEPDMYEQCEAAWKQSARDMDFIRLHADSFAATRNVSIDYAVMERVDNAVVVPFTTAWSDIGSWESVYSEMEHDELGNVSVGDTLLHDTKNCYINADSRLVALLGVEGIGVIETSDCVLVVDMSQSQHTRVLAELLKKHNRNEADLHTKVFRPWGNYESINSGQRFQVKRITVKPHGKLSLQKHFHRAEHWVVVSGTAIVTVGDQEIMLSENESTYIPLGTMHRLENPGTIPLELIEVQSGSYLGEDDIVRFDDVYGRLDPAQQTPRN